MAPPTPPSSTSIVRTQAHLRTNRTLILTRSLLSGLVGVVPLPYIDDLLAGAVRAQLIRRLAEIRGIDVDGNAVAALSDPAGSRLLSMASMGAVAAGVARPGWRKIASRLGTSFMVVRRVDETIESFQVGTLFDHYCARMHVGAALDGKRAVILRHAMSMSIASARNDLLKRAFSEGLRTASKFAGGVPRAFDMLRTGARGADIDGQLDESLVGSAARSVETKVEGLEQGYLEQLVTRFEVGYRAIQAARPSDGAGGGGAPR